MSDKETPLDRYKRLRASAEFFRKYADPNASAGPSFWNDLKRCVGAAIADCTAGAPEGVTWRLSKEEMFAIGYVADIAPLLLAAAKRLDRDAEGMLEELRGQSAEVAALVAELERAPK